MYGPPAEGRRNQIQGGAAGWFVSVNGSGAAGFGERKSKPGGGRLFGLDRFRVRFFLFFFVFFFQNCSPPNMQVLETPIYRPICC